MGLEIMRKRIDHRMKMGELQKQADRLLMAPHEEPEEEQVATAEEFFPDNCTAIPYKPETASDLENGKSKVSLQGLESDMTPENAHIVTQESGPGSQAEPAASITLPELMELVKNPGENISLPVCLVTNQGVPIGRCLDYGVGPDERMQATLELVDNLAEAPQGLTVSDLKKSFAEAGIRLIICQPGMVKEEEPVIALPPAAQEKVSLQSGSKGNGERLLTLF
jgi:hypothetical protein